MTLILNISSIGNCYENVFWLDLSNKDYLKNESLQAKSCKTHRQVLLFLDQLKHISTDEIEFTYPSYAYIDPIQTKFVFSATGQKDARHKYLRNKPCTLEEQIEFVRTRMFEEQSTKSSADQSGSEVQSGTEVQSGCAIQ